MRLFFLPLLVVALLLPGCRTVVKPSKADIAKQLQTRHGLPVDVIEVGSNYPNSGHKGKARAGTPPVTFSFQYWDGKIRSSSYQWARLRHEATEHHGAFIDKSYGRDAVMEAVPGFSNTIPEAGFPAYTELLRDHPAQLDLVSRIYVFRDLDPARPELALQGVADYMNELRALGVGEMYVSIKLFDEAFFQGKNLADYEFGFQTRTGSNFEGTVGYDNQRGAASYRLSSASPPVTAKALLPGIRTDKVIPRSIRL